MEEEDSPKKVVQRLISKYVSFKPTRIRLRLDPNGEKSYIEVVGRSLDQKAEYAKSIGFNSFGNGVLEAYEKAFGKLKEVPISFRETIYENEKVKLHFYPTGSAGIFDVFVDYR